MVLWKLLIILLKDKNKMIIDNADRNVIELTKKGMSEKPLGSWQADFIKQLINEGLTREQAIISLGLCCERTQIAYNQGMQDGYDKGYKSGYYFS